MFTNFFQDILSTFRASYFLTDGYVDNDIRLPEIGVALILIVDLIVRELLKRARMSAYLSIVISITFIVLILSGGNIFNTNANGLQVMWYMISVISLGFIAVLQSLAITGIIKEKTIEKWIETLDKK